jgi:predicted HicB family RNase H-like nuclease
MPKNVTTKSLRMPPSLAEEIDAAVSLAGVSFSEWVRRALAREAREAKAKTPAS